MKSLFPKIIKVRRNKRMIDLSEIGHEEMLIEEIAHKDDKQEEAHIVDPYEEYTPPIPDWCIPQPSIVSKFIRICNPVNYLP